MRTSTTFASACNRRGVAAVVALAALAACADGDIGGPVPDSALEGIALTAVAPAVAVPGTVLVLSGRSFVDAQWGDTRLRLSGTFAGRPVDVAVPARFAAYDRLEVDVGDVLYDALGGELGELVADAVVEVDSRYDGRTYRTDPLAVAIRFERELAPRIASLQTGGVIFANDDIAIEGDGLLLGGSEGRTIAVVEGCFAPAGGGACARVAPVEVPVVPAAPFDRTRGTFRFVPAIAGIGPGRFDGTVALRNDHAATGARVDGDRRTAQYERIEAAVFDLGPTAASLGQYVVVRGGGFVGVADGGATLLALSGTFSPDGGGPAVPVDLELVAEVVDGHTARYVLNEEDALGQAIDLRAVTGTFAGTVRPIVQYGDEEVAGEPVAAELRVAPVAQVVYLDFQPSYVESLRAFGLRAVDAQIRERVAQVVRRDYATIHLDVRLEPPDDFALYSVVDIAGPDPNGLGLLGYDNTPGKDSGNLRLYDRIGGVNALTQEDGYPGFGGVFIESLFGFSEHPEGHAETLPAADPAFDAIFDPFRPDRGGRPVSSADGAIVAGAVDGADCPAPDGDREHQIGCAVTVLGNLIGTIVSHEIGHSLGLANPYGEGFHNVGDAPNRLMDAGAARSFAERAELFGQGPSRFCDQEYAYLRDILPTSEPDDPTPRPPCF
ncbi:MAG: hypothetical protein D6689_10650 [Deltaproteobacteria bacterium]|nr:MAG: hypothetical protein D6689_10650 [Deltaproteobacteria bacterium]